MNLLNFSHAFLVPFLTKENWGGYLSRCHTNTTEGVFPWFVLFKVVEVEVSCFKHKCGSYEYSIWNMNLTTPLANKNLKLRLRCARPSHPWSQNRHLLPPGQRNLEIILQQKLPEEHAHSRPQPNTNPEHFGTLCLQIELQPLKENYGKPSSALWISDPNWDLGATLKSKNGLVGHLQLSSITSWVSKREAIYTPTSANTTVSLFPPSVKS